MIESQGVECGRQNSDMVPRFPPLACAPCIIPFLDCGLDLGNEQVCPHYPVQNQLTRSSAKERLLWVGLI